MKTSRTKKLPLMLAVGAFAFAAAGIGLWGRDIKIANAEPAEGPVTIKQFDALDREVEITVEYKNGKYILADFERNIYVYDGQTAYNDGVLTDDQNAAIEHDDDTLCSLYFVPIDAFSDYLYVSEDGNFDEMAVSLFYNTVAAYDYYSEANIGFDWRGVNGQSDEIRNNASSRANEYPIQIFAHANTTRWRNNAAYVFLSWFAESRIIVGDGSSNYLYHTGAEIDTLAHEYQHGVTRFLTQLNKDDGGLSIYGNPGALNEGISDMFGMLVKAKDRGLTPSDEAFWHIAGAVGEILRNAAHPNPTKNSASYSDAQRNQCRTPNCKHTGCYDTGYVHVNSTLFTHVQYVACQKSDYFTAEKIGKLWFEMVKNIPVDAEFMDFAEQIQNAAATLNFPQEAQTALSDALDECGFPQTHKVTFQNEQGNVLKITFVREGGKATAPSTQRDKDTVNQIRYIFKEWDKDFKNVTEDLTVTACYEEIHYYTVEFVDEDGKVLKKQEVDAGKSANAPAAPKKASTEQYTYIFKGWSGTYTNVQENLRIVAVFEAIERTYTVDYVVDDVKTSVTVTYGTAINVVPEGYDGWYTDKACTLRFTEETVTGNLTLYAKKISNGNGTTNPPDDNPPADNPPADNPPVEKPPVENPPKTDDNKSSAGLWIGIGVGAGVLVIGAAVAVVLILKKKKNNQ